MWNRKRIVQELRRLREYWNVHDHSLQQVVDYIILRPDSVRRDFYNALMKEGPFNETGQ